jgi:hypothetical protein
MLCSIAPHSIIGSGVVYYRASYSVNYSDHAFYSTVYRMLVYRRRFKLYTILYEVSLEFKTKFSLLIV